LYTAYTRESNREAIAERLRLKPKVSKPVYYVPGGYDSLHVFASMTGSERTIAMFGDAAFQFSVFAILSSSKVPDIAATASRFSDFRWRYACYGSYFGPTSGSAQYVACLFKIRYAICEAFRLYADGLVLLSVA